jgi:hypothetical protein
MQIITFLHSVGFYPSYAAGFMAACLASYFLGNPLMCWIYERFWTSTTPILPNETPEDNKKRRESLARMLDLKYGGVIGRLERIFYIYAVMSQQYGIVTSVIILKAFFGWIKTPSSPERQLRFEFEDKSQFAIAQLEYVTFHSYIYGNLWSLGFGLALGHFGTIASQLLKVYCHI